MDEEEYKILVNRGLTGVTQYQETYNLKIYEELHPYGPKRFLVPNKNSRKSNKSRSFEVTLGILLGLNNPIEDTFKMLLHAKYLMQKYPKAEINISFQDIALLEQILFPIYCEFKDPITSHFYLSNLFTSNRNHHFNS